MSRLQPAIGEIGKRPAGSLWGFDADSGAVPSHILRSEAFGASGGIFELYEEMEEKDPHLFAILQTRKNGVLSCGRKIVAASESRRDREIARFVEGVLGGIRNFDQSLLHILDALGKGFSVQEILWELREGQVRVRELKSRAPGRFVYDSQNRLCLRPLCHRGSESGDAGRAPLPLPERKFLVFTFGGRYDNPYGRGLCAHAYWICWMKKNNLKFWALFNEKFGAPTVVGKYGPGASEQDRRRLLEVIDSMQNDTGVAVPESIQLELLEARRGGNVSTYHEFARWCNDELSKLVLGATLTSDQGNGSGSFALAKVHEGVRNEYIESDARALEDAVNSQLVRWIVDFNFGPDAPAPRWVVDTTRADNLDREIQVDRQLVALGVALPRDYFYAKYKRPGPVGDEAVLCHDDQNLFQYHLAYGIVTVNEARERLGLPPTEWGERPVRPLSAPPQAESGAEGAEDLGQDAEDEARRDARLETGQEA
jgi:phage gp29-like protein